MLVVQSNKKQWACIQAAWDNYQEKAPNERASLAKLSEPTPGNSVILNSVY